MVLFHLDQYSCDLSIRIVVIEFSNSMEMIHFEMPAYLAAYILLCLSSFSFDLSSVVEWLMVTLQPIKEQS